ncbi:MAG: 5-(carboxyamino)imidazole ribonucleotide synthase [Cyanobacteria bacterium J06627_8]
MGDRVGIIGGGQLAWMMGMAAQKMGIDLIVQTPEPNDPAVSVAADVCYGAIANANVTAKLAQQCDVITFENEFVDLDALQKLERQGITFYPALASLQPLLDKYHQRQFFRAHHIPTPDFHAIERNLDSSQGPASPLDAIPASMLTFPVVLKSRRLGYDGQGTHIVKSNDALQTILKESRHSTVDWLLEAFVPFEKELAIMVARSADGAIVLYPVVETQQEQQVCRRVLMLPDLPEAVVHQVEAIAKAIVEKLNVVGIFGIELFLTASGDVLVNEVAPRTHNSGHYTLDACSVSQFEQQLRAVCQKPLQTPQRLSQGAVMVNLLGFESSQDDYLDRRETIAALPHTHVYWYGKTEARPGRKLGHATTLLHEANPQQLRDHATAIANQIESLWNPST